LRTKASAFRSFAIGIASLLVLVAGTRAAAQKAIVLHSFGSGMDGSFPSENLVFDSKGNLFGATSNGGAYGGGTVFELTPTTHGWAESVLYSFGKSGTDGYSPSGLVLDAAGNIYGTTFFGSLVLSGALFELINTGNGWTEKTLHIFGNRYDGANPVGSLIFDGSGNLYGATLGGGINGQGTVFEFSPTGNGEWKETQLHDFSIQDGQYPSAGVTFDAAGNFYGTTEYGGLVCNTCGVVFELTPTADGKWEDATLYSFQPYFRGDGQQPTSGVVLDAAGNVYGTTTNGGLPVSGCDFLGCGTVYELSSTGGSWKETVIYNAGNGREGFDLINGLTFDAAGNLYGTTSGGIGGTYGCGTVFKLSPTSGGSWSESLFFAFNSSDGCGPSGNLIFDAAGNLYGITAEGGKYGGGTVFEIVP